MAFELLDVRIGQVGVEASRAAIDATQAGPFGGIGRKAGYAQLFDAARTMAGQSVLPWHPEPLHRNRFWKKYVGELLGSYESEWAEIAWQKLVPLKALTAPLPVMRLHEGVRRSFSEAYVWPTGVGLLWNNWIEARMDAAGLIGILKAIRNGDVAYEAPDGTTGSEGINAHHYAMLAGLRTALLGDVKPGVQSEPITIVSIVRADSDETASAAALPALLKGIAAVWGEQPAILPGDRAAASGHSVYVAGRLRLVWLPLAFIADGRPHSIGCFHRNLLFSSLQAEMLATSALMLAQTRLPDGSLESQFQSTRERLGERIRFFTKGGGYSAPFLNAQLERQPILEALAAIGA